MDKNERAALRALADSEAANWWSFSPLVTPDTVRRMLDALDAAEAELNAWHSTLSAVMPGDFKDWHENSPAERPEVAAFVIRNLREQLDAALAQPEAVASDLEPMHAEPDADGWTQWVVPFPDSYMMGCCGCGLVHEMQFRVARYEPRPSDVHEVVSDPNYQAQFRARRAVPRRRPPSPRRSRRRTH